ncbi:surface-adhesin E family protein [Brevundimonas sp. DC300-4]|uniref:surface-adhesin E family protein n=1 Tax=Brevundimonas sp. DC300-4 TaxID=2804594 RepID=UPI003CF0F37B
MLKVLAGVVALWLGAGAAIAQDGFQPPWPAEGEDTIRWTVENIDVIPGSIVWSAPELIVAMERDTLRRTGSLARAWFRWEYLKAESAATINGRSVLVLREADCSAGRARLVAISIYPGNNLTGPATNAERPQATWIFDRPGQLSAAQTAAACEGTFLFTQEDVVGWAQRIKP